MKEMNGTMTFMLFALVVFLGVFIMTNAEVGPLMISDGYYRVYHMHEAYSTKTGEPIYWLIADSLKWERIDTSDVWIHKNKIRFYQIPRQSILKRHDGEPKADKVSSFVLTVRAGKAMFNRAGFPPTVFTRGAYEPKP